MIDPSVDNTGSELRSSTFYKRILLILFIAFLFISMLGVASLYKGRNKNKLVPIFDPATQVIPQGTTALPLHNALTAFNFSKPLPFFEERNVVQSLNLEGDQEKTPPITVSHSVPGTDATPPTQTTPPSDASPVFLSYRVFGQSKEAVREALIAYFTSLGWKQIDDHQSNQQVLIFGSDNKRIISINILEVPSTPGRESNIVITLSLRVFTL